MLTLAAILLGFTLDALLGDPPRCPHMVVGMGRLITALEAPLRRLPPLLGGALLALFLPAVCIGVTWLLLYLAALVHPLLRLLVESLLIWQCLALRSLTQAGQAVRRELERGDLPAARNAVARVVGRDTADLDEAGVIRAAIETVAENTADGVIAPLFYLALGGAPLAVAYKAINTMDSMVGYRNASYLYFGRPAARLDDIANLLPARIAALLLILAAPRKRNALCIWWRDRYQHKSPNAGHPEAACAGALGLRLGGPNYYGGQLVNKPYIGDDTRLPLAEDICGAIRLLNWSGLMGLLLCLITRGVGG